MGSWVSYREIQTLKKYLAAGLKLQAAGAWIVMKDFKKLLIWQLGMDIVDKVYDIVSWLLQEEKYGLRSQMTRSAISVPKFIEKIEG